MRSAKQDEEFAAYVAASRPALWRTAFLLCGNVAQADDLVQSALLKLYVAWPRLVRGDRLDGYARRIIVNSHIDEMRRPWRAWYPFTVSWSPDGTTLLYAAWRLDGRALPGGVIAVPVDRPSDVTVLTDAIDRVPNYHSHRWPDPDVGPATGVMPA